MKVNGITITHANRPVFPKAGLSKGEVAQYYFDMAPLLLKHVAARPLAVVRCPQGRQKTCFFQKHRSDGMPDEIGSVAVTETQNMGQYITIDSAEGLVALAQFGVLEIHPWLACNDDLDHPDMMVFDLDPAKNVAWEEVVKTAHLMRETLNGLGLVSFPKLTGGKGLHLVIPLQRQVNFDHLKAAARSIAERVRDRNPERLTTESSKPKRRGKIFLDYLRNSNQATAVAPYSLRAHPGAPVATPIPWDEVTPQIRPDRYTATSLPRHLAEAESHPWEGFFDLNQSLPKSILHESQVEK